MPDDKPTVCIDFDGTCHRYSKGWYTGDIYDEATPGLFPWLHAIAAAGFNIVIYSVRADSAVGREAMAVWFKKQAIKNGGNMIPPLSFTARKPPAVVTIDDRVIRFEGDWSAPELQPAAIAKFQPWTETEEMRRTRTEELARSLGEFVCWAWEPGTAPPSQSHLIKRALAVLQEAAPSIYEETWHAVRR
jgi:hypothetical protein